MWMLLLLAACFLFALHWLLSHPYGYWKRRGVPFPEPTMLVGNLGSTLLARKNFGQVYKDIYNEYKDYLYVGLFKIRKPAILVRDIDLIKEILVKEFSSFHDNDIVVDEKIDPVLGKNPFVLKGQKWKVIRSKITSAITSGKIKSMHCLMLNVAKNMVEYLEKTAPQTMTDGIETKEMCAKFTTDVVASCAFGLEGKSFEDHDSEFRTMGRKFLTPSFWMGVKHTIIFVMPSLSKFLRIKFMPGDVQEWFSTIVLKTIKYREENKIVRNDYIDLMMSLKSNMGEYEFTDVDVVAQAMTFYADGFETSSLTLSFVLYELALNTDIQTKLREEIENTKAKHGGELTYEAIHEMQYLDNVLSEGLRKYPPGMFLGKVCTKPFTLPPPRGEGTGKNVNLEMGTSIIIPVYGIHSDPAYYPDPERFNPERFTDENKKSRPKYCYLPFGEGPRMCLGQRFAVAQAKVGIASVISDFELRVTNKTKSPLVIDPRYFMTSAKGGLWLNYTKIHK